MNFVCRKRSAPVHSKDARTQGETEQRIYALSVWEETPFSTDRERAALALTEAITLVGEGHVPDAVYERVGRASPSKS